MQKRNKVLSGLMIVGLLMVSQSSYASIGEMFNQYVGNEFANANSFYIILAVVSAGVLGSVFQKTFNREEKKSHSKVRVIHHYNNRPRHIIKKTA